MQHSRISLSRIKRENTFNARHIPRMRRRTVHVLEVVFPDGCIRSNKNRDVHTLWKQTRPGAARDEIFAKLLATLRTCSLLLHSPMISRFTFAGYFRALSIGRGNVEPNDR